ncbi:MAG TPA: sugar phosphate nucleotidyltransferase [bacterium]|nr:sugar phosphate nucleotidyltransferase [bacterium]
MAVIAVIMAGGSGKRFWPLSRENRAKQSLALFSEKTLLAETIERIMPLTRDILIVSSIKQREHILADARRYDGVRTLFEPVGRNTAPCIALALRAIERHWGGGHQVVVLPADHHIARPDDFRTAIRTALATLDTVDGIGTIGIRPDHPETGYGYINTGDILRPGVFAVKRFEEKPDRARAETFVKSGNYLWNGGIFLFRQATMARELAALTPDIFAGVGAIPDLDAITAAQYGAVRSISIDYAVMEKTAAPVFSVAGDFGWNDIGSWAGYYDLLPKDAAGNAVRGPVHFVESTGNLVVNLTDRPIFLLRKNGQLVIVTGDAMLTADLADHQEVRRVTEYLEKSGLAALL